MTQGFAYQSTDRFFVEAVAQRDLDVTHIFARALQTNISLYILDCFGILTRLLSELLSAKRAIWQ